MQHDETLVDDLVRIRQSRRTAALVEYRQAIEAIASGDVTPAELGAGLDDVMLRLDFHDDYLAQDVQALREHQQRLARIAEIEKHRDEHEQRVAEAVAALATLRDEQKSFAMRYREAEGKRREACRPLGIAQTSWERIAKIEKANVRIFGPLESDDG